MKTSYLKKIVLFCIAYLAVMNTASFVANCFGIDTSKTLYYTDWVFGGELMMTCLVKAIDRKAVSPIVGNITK